MDESLTNTDSNTCKSESLSQDVLSVAVPWTQRRYFQEGISHICWTADDSRSPDLRLQFWLSFEVDTISSGKHGYY
jgi:hypothetical protein